MTWVDNGAEQQHHVAMFYDKEQVNGEKNKNSNTGMMALRRLVIFVLNMCAAFGDNLAQVDPALNGGTSLLHTLVPSASRLVISGDTGNVARVVCGVVTGRSSDSAGNGFRGVPMAWFHSTFPGLYDLEVEQIPLPPRHAHNPSDRLIARLNQFFRKLMRATFLLGTKQFYEALQRATNTRQPVRLIVKNCTVLHCSFTATDYIQPPPLANYVVNTASTAAPAEKWGIMKIGYLKHVPDDQGVVIVRKFGDLTMSDGDNPAAVFDLLVRADPMCQTCSNAEVNFTPS